MKLFSKVRHSFVRGYFATFLLNIFLERFLSDRLNFILTMKDKLTIITLYCHHLVMKLDALSDNYLLIRKRLILIFQKLELAQELGLLTIKSIDFSLLVLHIVLHKFA